MKSVYHILKSMHHITIRYDRQLLIRQKKMEITEILSSFILPKFPRCGSPTMLHDKAFSLATSATWFLRDRTDNTEVMPTFLSSWGQSYFWKIHILKITTKASCKRSDRNEHCRFEEITQSNVYQTILWGKIWLSGLEYISLPTSNNSFCNMFFFSVLVLVLEGLTAP